MLVIVVGLFFKRSPTSRTMFPVFNMRSVSDRVEASLHSGTSNYHPSLTAQLDPPWLPPTTFLLPLRLPLLAPSSAPVVSVSSVDQRILACRTRRRAVDLSGGMERERHMSMLGSISGFERVLYTMPFTVSGLSVHSIMGIFIIDHTSLFRGMLPLSLSSSSFLFCHFDSRRFFSCCWF